jgi:hypothetical protein
MIEYLELEAMAGLEMALKLRRNKYLRFVAIQEREHTLHESGRFLLKIPSVDSNAHEVLTTEE